MYKPFDLSGKVALVTGGNGGIGFGMADALAQAGAHVVIWGTNEGKNTEALAKLKAHGRRAGARKVNVASEGEVIDGMGALLKEFGRVDTVVANAGIGRGARSFHEMTLDTWRAVNAVNAEGLFLTFREACKHMVERAGKGDQGGSLIGISSLSAFDGAPRNQAYAGTKGAVLSIIRGLAVEYGRYGVRANAIAPGWIATDMTAGVQHSDVFNSKVITRAPIRRWGEPEDFGGIAVYLASDASKYHTGDTIVIDGGYKVF
ncbi:MAG: SDR family oxidoreductase [Alphaproteobacteria bacterium]|nr:SDR family oxidoreductase [Alphaproteobacteria bacterium]MBL6936362.1 SDR family oxidoreductase [Alphaproteobacteria bacterium]MBL7098587.1 SDR family oxidoreductase [Alphaproteobacteria bacterium]